jgi:LmbE family N-acetylglucosaminyl deacetylase
VPLEDAEIKRVLAVTAHPDDVDFMAAGAIGAMTDRGVQVAYCICTDGDAGGFDPSVSREEMGRIRRREQTEAALEVGVTELHFLGFPDGRLEPSLELRREISRVIRIVRPDVVITQSPDRNYESVYASHPDHRACGGAALDAVYPDARNPFAHPELAAAGHEAWAVPEVWLSASPGQGEKVIDVTEQFDRKIAALLRHASQKPPEAPDDLDKARDFLQDMMRGWMGANALQGGLAEGRLAETYKVVPTAG